MLIAVSITSVSYVGEDYQVMNAFEADDTCNSPQSEITIENQDGEVVGYYAADHENGTYFSWSAKP